MTTIENNTLVCAPSDPPAQAFRFTLGMRNPTHRRIALTGLVDEVARVIDADRLHPSVQTWLNHYIAAARNFARAGDEHEVVHQLDLINKTLSWERGERS